MSDPTRPASPFVGLKPFEEGERAVFFGRDDDADRLVNVLLSSSLTVVHALSGVGKTSLLRTLVTPELRSMGITVVYVDRWDSNTCRGIWQEISQLAGAPEPKTDETISGYLTRVVSGWQDDSAIKDATLVLILDQFEEVLIQGGEGAESLMASLGQLERGTQEIHALLSMREEFLARLSKYDEYFVNVLRHTYPLEHLDRTRVREAIVRPVHDVFGVDVEDSLVDALTEDLGRGRDRKTERIEVELPFLQLICDRLWQARNKGPLTRELYERLGRREGIIAQYLNQVTKPLSPVELDALSVLVLFLAPPSGVKTSYSREDLIAMSRDVEPKPQPRTIDKLLTHLNTMRVTQVLESADGERYQLYHDAFIKVLRRWARAHRSRREAALAAAEVRIEAERSARKGRKALWTMGAVVLGLIAAVALLSEMWSTQAELRERADMERARFEALSDEKGDLLQSLEVAADETAREKARAEARSRRLDNYRASTLACVKRSKRCAKLMLGSLDDISALRSLAQAIAETDQMPAVPGFDPAKSSSRAAVATWIRASIWRLGEPLPIDVLQPPDFDRAMAIVLQQLHAQPTLSLGAFWRIHRQTDALGPIGDEPAGGKLPLRYLKGWQHANLGDIDRARFEFDGMSDSDARARLAQAYVRLRMASNDWLGTEERIEAAKAAYQGLARAIPGPIGPANTLLSRILRLIAVDDFLRLTKGAKKLGDEVPTWQRVTEGYTQLIASIGPHPNTMIKAWLARIHELTGSAHWSANLDARNQEERRRILRASIQAYTRALDIDLKVARVHRLRGRSYRRLADKTKGLDRQKNACSALADLRQALAIDSDDSWAHHELALLYRRAGMYNDARRHYQIAVQKAPRQEVSHIALSLMLSNPSEDADYPIDSAGALHHAREACAISVTSTCRRALAQAYASAGEWALAVETQTEAVRLLCESLEGRRRDARRIRGCLRGKRPDVKLENPIDDDGDMVESWRVRLDHERIKLYQSQMLKPQVKCRWPTVDLSTCTAADDEGGAKESAPPMPMNRPYEQLPAY